MAVDSPRLDATDVSGTAESQGAQLAESRHAPGASNGTTTRVDNDAVEQATEEHGEAREDDDDEDDDDDDEETEPILKYARLTSSLSTAYRNGSSTSAVLTTADIMV